MNFEQEPVAAEFITSLSTRKYIDAILALSGSNTQVSIISHPSRMFA